MSRTNLVPNGGFESSLIAGMPGQWQPYHGSDVTRDTIEHLYGNHSCKVVSPFSGPSSSDFGLLGQISLPDGPTYTHSGWVKGEGTAIGKTITIYLQEAAGTGISATQQYTLTGSWQRMPVTRVGFNGGGGANLFYIVQDVTGITIGDTFYVDGVQVEVGSVATDYIETDGWPVTVEDAGVQVQQHGGGMGKW